MPQSPARGTAGWRRFDCSIPILSTFCHPVWNLVGGVHFNLAENRKDPEAPFAFLATYTARSLAQGSAQHLPLSLETIPKSTFNRRDEEVAFMETFFSAAGITVEASPKLTTNAVALPVDTIYTRGRASYQHGL